jgi:predicted enzyme related to lactoylglutathione lyase
MTARDPLGRFVWYDLMTTDPDKAMAFYTQLVGWGTKPWEGGDTPYTLWTANGVTIGGVMHLPEDAVKGGAPPHWLGYVAVPDPAAAAAKVREMGGGILHPATEIPSAGSFAVLCDPQGAAFAVYAPTEGNDYPPEATARVGEVSWRELATTDHAAAFRFYNTMFKWDKTESMDLGEMGIYQMFGRAGMTLGAMFNKPAEMPGPPFWLYYIRVENADHTAERVKQLGGQVLNGPMDVPGGDRVAQCMDPQGAAFAIHSSAPYS